MEEDQMCLECLQRRIHSDFSNQLIFSLSPLPFASSAVVQVPHSSGESSPQFTLAYLPTSGFDCLRKYIEECSPEDLEGEHSGESNGKTPSGANRNGCNGSTCKFSSRFSCSRTITSLAPIARVGHSSYSVFEDLASNYSLIEDDILGSINLLIEGQATGRDSINFLSLIGIPSFDEKGFPGCLRHPNIAPILGLLKTPEYINLVLPKTPYTLENIFQYSPKALKSEWQIKFLTYQLLSAVAHMHGLGIAHGNICPSNIMLTDSCWSWLRIIDKPSLSPTLSETRKEHSLTPTSTVGFCVEGCPSVGLYADLKLSQSTDWYSAFNSWWRGELSNFEYLLVLNRLAGRRWGDHTFHTVMPWVIDFSVKPEVTSDAGWRDLSKSKWRLAKGDEQLDFTYSTSEIPHHVSDECLSELAVCSYKARRLPLSVLRMAVRSVYEPNEYPSSMSRLYQWTPDECIPEFYCDPQIFYSVHTGMTDLAVPSWVDTPEEFIKLHRSALESDRVSCHIHHWIDITFGCKMSGEAAVAAKNVMLPVSDPTMPRSVGRRQLFTQPHPARQAATRKHHDTTTKSTAHHFLENGVPGYESFNPTAQLQELEEAAAFCEHARHLSPLYCYHVENVVEDDSSTEESLSEGSEKNTSMAPDYVHLFGQRCGISLDYILEKMEVDDDTSVGYQELLLWSQKSSHSKICLETIARDIFSIGCILAELHLRRPLFNPASLAVYLDTGVLPSQMKELPPHTEVLVESCLRKDWRRKPSAKCILESPYFPTTVRSSYLFLGPLQLLAKDGLRLRYAANFAKQGAFKAMGPFAAEMCASYCLPLVLTSLSNIEAEWAYTLLKELLKCLKPDAVKTLILPAIQKILQASGYLYLKVLLLQESFVREIWKRNGKQAYLETIHPLVILNLHAAPHKSSAAAAAVLLIGSSEELGAPVTVHQTILPLIQCFGKGICSDGIDVVVRIGGLLGENFVVRQILPLLTNVVRSCIDASYMTKPEPMQNWSCLALIDCLMSLDGLLSVLPTDVVIKELIEDGSFLHVMVLQADLDISVLQVAATSLIAICERIGPDLTALYVLPKLKELFDELAFSQETRIASGTLERSSKLTKSKSDENGIESRMDLVFLLYPSFASLLGIEKLRQGCATWLLLEQFLLRCHNWKGEYTGESFRCGADSINSKRPIFKSSTSEYNPAKLLLNGVGWSTPQNQGSRSSKNLVPLQQANELDQSPAERRVATSDFGNHEPWHWFPSPAASWDGPDFLGRFGNLKDELPWKIRASVIHSIRAHHGALRSLAVCQDECTVFTAGVGPGFKGTVQKWDLSRSDCISAYYGHEEVVNDISIFSSYERVASCDGTVHVWNSQTGKLIAIFAESSMSSVHASMSSSPLTSPSMINADQSNMLNSSPPSSGILSAAFDGSLYTCMHHLQFNEKLVVGTGNGSLRFIDVPRGQKLHLWKTESGESIFPSLISSICACGSDKMQGDGAAASPSWIAAGLSSGMCRLLDVRSGNVISTWRAHDGYVTKLAAPADHLLVSSSLDRTLRVWDLRRNWPPQPIVFRGHNDSVLGFSVWGQDVISIAKNKIGLSSLSRSANEDGQHRITPQYLYLADRGMRNMSVLSSLSILPFSRLFLVGTEDGHLKICC